MRNNSVKNTYERKSAFHIWKVQMCTSMYFAPLTCIRASQRGHRCHSRRGHRGALSCVSWGVYQHPWPLPTGYPLENVSGHSKCPRLTTKAAKSDFIHAYLPQSRTYVYKGAPARHQEGQRLIPRGNCRPCLTGAGTRGIYSKGPLVLPPFCICVVLRGRCCMNQNSKPPLWVPRFPRGDLPCVHEIYMSIHFCSSPGNLSHYRGISQALGREEGQLFVLSYFMYKMRGGR